MFFKKLPDDINAEPGLEIVPRARSVGSFLMVFWVDLYILP